MLKKLKKQHIWNCGVIEDNKVILPNFEILKIQPSKIISFLLRRSYRGMILYTYENEYLDYFFDNLRGVEIKRIYGGTDLMAIKITNKKENITIVNAKFLLPKKPPNLYKSLYYIFQVIGNGIKPTYTSASYALRLWRSKFQKETLRGINSRIERFTRRAYAGGRSEIFRSSLEKGYYYDVNSMYGAQMCKKMPTGYVYFSESRNKNRIGFYECEVDQTIQEIPVLWKKIGNKTNKKEMLCFPADKFVGIFSGVELDLAIQQGAKVKIKRALEWQKAEPIFKEFIEYMYELRKRDDCEPWLNSFIKKVIVSFYGKFAERREYEKIVQAKNVEQYYELSNIKKAKIISETEWTIAIPFCEKIKQNSHILPHISAHISALGRVEIYNKMLENIQIGGKIAYVETDAIFTDTKINTNLSDKMGDWKLVGEISEAQFLQAKTYSFIRNEERKYIASGVPKGVDLSLYFQGKDLKVYKKQKYTQQKKEYKIKIKNAPYIKRNIEKEGSCSLTIPEILEKMNST